jgi:hypothetical protein
MRRSLRESANGLGMLALLARVDHGRSTPLGGCQHFFRDPERSIGSQPRPPRIRPTSARRGLHSPTAGGLLQRLRVRPVAARTQWRDHEARHALLVRARGPLVAVSS